MPISIPYKKGPV